MHKARIVQAISLPDVDARVEKNSKAHNNAHLLKSEDVFLDMLTDSGTNAMSDRQLAAMMEADDAYAGSASYYKLESRIKEVFGMEYFLPAHQGRACEHLLCRAFIRQGQKVLTNYHFTTFRAHCKNAGGKLEELVAEDAFETESSNPFKGDMDIARLESSIKLNMSQIAFVRIEAGTNLIGGQPVSLGNMQHVRKLCRKYGVAMVLDASLLSDNAYFIKKREAAAEKLTIRQIIERIAECFDVIYFSGRKLTSARGGGMCFRHKGEYLTVRDLVPIYEGFLTYGGVSVRELEAMAIGLEETMDEEFCAQGPIFIEHMAKMLIESGVPVVTPPGGLGVHLDAARFCEAVPAQQYPGAALGAALYLCSGIRGTERGTLSEDRDESGNEVFANMELLRLALPRRVFTLSQIDYAVDRIAWLYGNRQLIGGLRFEGEEPKALRFFFGELAPIGSWQRHLVSKFKADFGNSL
jgi:tryptophanase